MTWVKVSSSGSMKNIEKFFNRIRKKTYLNALDAYGQMGVEVLRDGTPKDSGITSDSWNYIVETNKTHSKITWTNDSVNDGVNIAVILQYGHGTGTGGWVEGVDYINPALHPIFQEIADRLWKEVSRK